MLRSIQQAETRRGGFRFHAFMRRLAYDRGLRACTFATRDEWSWPGYDKAYRAGQRRSHTRSAP